MDKANPLVYIVIPTYNEAANIASLVQKIIDINPNTHTIVVDDNSPDGTGKIVDKLCVGNPHIICIHREGKGGRGAACLVGFTYALNAGADILFEMDADFSHDPREIPLFLEKIKHYDMVLGSRYLRGGKVINWGAIRRILSKLSNIYARFFLQVPISDYTNGYRCYRRHTFDFIDFNSIVAKGYIVLSEIVVQLYHKGLAIGELPTLFVNRARGESNLNLKEIFGAVTSVNRLWWRYRHVKRPLTPPPGTARAK